MGVTRLGLRADDLGAKSVGKPSGRAIAVTSNRDTEAVEQPNVDQSAHFTPLIHHLCWCPPQNHPASINLRPGSLDSP
jgi:hypothetical protein